MRSKGSTEPSGLSRRDFLRLGGVGVADVTLLRVVGAAELSAREGSPCSSPVAGFGEYDVPVSVRLAMGYANTRWEMPPPEASDYEPGDPRGRGAYGITRLVRNGTGETCSEASSLTGLPEEEFKTDRKPNLLGGTALLAEARGKRPGRLGDYLGAVSGTGAGEIYSGRVFDVTKEGAYETIPDDDEVELPSEQGEL